MSDNVEPLHDHDPRLVVLANDLREVIESRMDGRITVAAVMGILQMLILELYEEARGPRD